MQSICKKNDSYTDFNMVTAAVIVWGATVDHYMNTGFSISIIVFAVYFIFTRWKKYQFPVWHIDKRVYWAMGILYGALFFVTLFHLENMSNLYGGMYCASGFLRNTLPMWMLLYVGGMKDVRKTCCAVLYCILFAICIYGIYKYFYFHEVRLTSFYFFPTRIGMMLDMFIPITVACCAYYWKQIAFRYVSFFLLMLEVITMILAKVRGSLLAMAFATAIVCIIWLLNNKNGSTKKMQKRIVSGTIIFFILAVLYGVSIGWGDHVRMFGGERLLMWQSSYSMWLDHPFTGIGLNEWQGAYAEGIYHPESSKEAGQVMPHNVFIYFFATGGTIAGVAYCVYCILISTFLIFNTMKNGNNPFSWALLFLFLAGTMHGLLDETFIYKLTGRIIYMLLGVGFIFLKDYSPTSRNLDSVSEYEKY